MLNFGSGKWDTLPHVVGIFFYTRDNEGCSVLGRDFSIFLPRRFVS